MRRNSEADHAKKSEYTRSRSMFKRHKTASAEYFGFHQAIQRSSGNRWVAMANTIDLYCVDEASEKSFT